MTMNISGIMNGKKGLIMGVANDHSIAWGIAQMLSRAGADLAFTYQGDALKKRVEPLAKSVGSELIMPCDVEDDASMEAMVDTLKSVWGSVDFVVHAIAFSDKSALRGPYMDVTRDNFTRTLAISAFSFTDTLARLKPLLSNGASALTLTYGGSERVIPNYNVMGVAKAALEASVRYLAADLGTDNIRVNALSAGPVRTLAGAGIGDARFMFNYQATHAPLKRAITLEDVGGAALYLLSDLSSGVTGELHYVDAGYNIIGLPRAQDVENAESA